MAKHKPKKIKSPDEPEDADKKDLPPTEPVRSEEDKTYAKKKLDKLFWLRVGLAVIAGISATFIFEPIEGEDRRWASIAFMIIIFIVSVVIGKVMNPQLPKSDRKKLLTTGIGSYIFIYLFMWILSYTIMHLPSQSGISNPLT